MESLRKCAVRFHDGALIIIEADSLDQKDDVIIAKKRNDITGVFNMSQVEAAYLTVQQRKTE